MLSLFVRFYSPYLVSLLLYLYLEDIGGGIMKLNFDWETPRAPTHRHTRKNEPFAPLLKPFLYLLLPNALPTPKRDSKGVAGQQRLAPSHASEAFQAS
jgi:hypothetical protein